MSNNAASSTPIRSLRFCTACKLLLPLLLLLLSFTSVLTSPLCCCRSCCCCLWSRPSSCLLFFRYRIPQALQSDLGPVGPLRHMGVVVARHSTQPLAPLSATAMPSISLRSAEPIGAGGSRGQPRSVAGSLGEIWFLLWSLGCSVSWKRVVETRE